MITQFPCSKSVAFQGDVVSFVSCKSNESRKIVDPAYIGYRLSMSNVTIFRSLHWGFPTINLTGLPENKYVLCTLCTWIRVINHGEIKRTDGQLHIPKII